MRYFTAATLSEIKTAWRCNGFPRGTMTMR